jgi:hypothetical protein
MLMTFSSFVSSNFPMDPSSAKTPTHHCQMSFLFFFFVMALLDLASRFGGRGNGALSRFSFFSGFSFGSFVF